MFYGNSSLANCPSFDSKRRWNCGALDVASRGTANGGARAENLNGDGCSTIDRFRRGTGHYDGIKGVLCAGSS